MSLARLSVASPLSGGLARPVAKPQSPSSPPSQPSCFSASLASPLAALPHLRGATSPLPKNAPPWEGQRPRCPRTRRHREGQRPRCPRARRPGRGNVLVASLTTLTQRNTLNQLAKKNRQKRDFCVKNYKNQKFLNFFIFPVRFWEFWQIAG